MFKRKRELEVLFMNKEEGFSSTSKATVSNDGKLIDFLQSLYDRYGELVIDYMDHEEIHLETISTLKEDDIEEKAGEIKELVVNLFRNKAIPVTAYAVLAKGSLKGVFHEKGIAQLKKKALLRKGYAEGDIIIAPIEIGSMKDFNCEGGE